MNWLGFERDEPKKYVDRHAEVFTRRLADILASDSGLEDADPDEVEARLRNISHGTGRP